MVVNRWFLAAAVCWCMFANHYARDVTGTMEREIEVELHISSEKFQLLNSVYFAPNLITPLVFGVLSQRFGGSNMLLIVYIVAAVGHCLVGAAGHLRSYSMLLAGRTVLGLTYESIDVAPFPILSPLFVEDWPLLVGFVNAGLRMGSVVSFVLSPIMYGVGGLTAGLWTSSLVGLSGFFAAVSLRYMTGTPIAADITEENDSVRPSPSHAGRRYYVFAIYAAIGAILYAAIVPFWFYGGAFLRSKWGYTLGAADALMLLVEGGMVVLSPPLGCLLNAYCKKTVPRLGFMMGASSAILISIVLLAFMPPALPAMLAMLLLSTSYAAANTVFWSLSADFIPPGISALGSGILGSSLNLGSSVLPIVMANASSEKAALMLLGFAAFLSVLIILCLCIVLSLSKRRLFLQGGTVISPLTEDI